MAGFAALIGGAGDAAQEYGHQIRGILEQRRGHMVDFLTNLATNETDPQRQAEYHDHINRLLSGEDMAKVLKSGIPMVQKHMESNQALSDIFGGAPKQPQTQPAPAGPGSTPGTAQALKPMAAAQPSMSLVQPQKPIETGIPNIPPVQAQAPAAAAQIAPGLDATIQPPANPPSFSENIEPAARPSTGIPGLEMPETMESIRARYNAMPEMQTQAGRAKLYPQMQAEMQQSMVHAEKIRDLQNQIAIKKFGLDQFLKENPQLQPWEKAYYSSQGYGLTPMPFGSGMASAMFSPIHQGNLTADQVLRTYPAEAQQAGITPGSHPVDVWVNKITGKPSMIGSKAVGNAILQGYDQQTGQPIMMEASRYGEQGAIKPVDGAVAAPASVNSIIKGVGSDGSIEATSQARNFTHAPNIKTGLVAPTMLPVTRSATVYNPDTGETHQTNSVTRRGGSGGGGVDSRFGGTPPARTGGGSTPTHSEGGALLGTPAYQQRVKTAVQTLMIPNQSESQVASAEKLLGPPGAPFRNAVMREYWDRKATDGGPVAWDMATAERAQLSTQALRHIDTINTIIGKLEAHNELGPLAGRWNEIWSGKLGKDLTDNQDYTALKNNVDLLTKLMGRIHGGARGGGSIQMINSFKDKLNVDKMDPATLRSAIGAERDWISTYADPAHTALPQKPGAAGAIAPVGVDTDKVNKVLNKYR